MTDRALKYGPWAIIMICLGALILKPDLWNNAGFAMILGLGLLLAKVEFGVKDQ